MPRRGLLLVVVFAWLLESFLVVSPSCAQTTAPNEWTWVGGNGYTGNVPGSWGTLGVPSPANLPGIRYRSATWTDSAGNFWLFGGAGEDATVTFGWLNDLWMYSPSTAEWTWVGGNNTVPSGGKFFYPWEYTDYVGQPGTYGTPGTFAPANLPGGRGNGSTWVDKQGNVWLFGGTGIDSNSVVGLLNDLWELNPATMQWAWMGGSNALGANCFQPDLYETDCAAPGVYGTLGTPAKGNTPPGRKGGTSWTDAQGNLWLFGGWGFNLEYQLQFYYNDLWEFSPITGRWAWMGGSSTGEGSICIQSTSLYYQTCGEAGMYTSLGQPSAGEMPGARSDATSWTDTDGNFWMFGGQGFDANGNFSDLNDLWEFNPSTKEWTWMTGRNISPGYYNECLTGVSHQDGSFVAGNTPGGRWGANGWKDASGNFWLFGGVESGDFGNTYFDTLDDVWVYSPSANEWALTKGTNLCIANSWPPTLPTPGTQGQAAPGNTPGDRLNAANWTDANGNFWIAGGSDRVAEDLNNDLWEYQPSAPAPAPGFDIVNWNYQGFNSVGTLTINAGMSGTQTINSIVGDGFSGTINLTADGWPSGITASFSPASLTGSAVSQVTVSVDFTVAPGNYTLTVDGTSGGVTHSTTITIQVLGAQPTFSLSVTPASLSVQSGSQGSVTITLTPVDGFNSPVTLSFSALPNYTTGTFSQSTLTPPGSTSTTLTFKVSKATAANRQKKPWLPETIVAVILGSLGLKRRRGTLRASLLIVLCAGGLGILNGCGGGGSGNTTPPIQSQTATVLISGNTPSMLQTATVTITAEY